MYTDAYTAGTYVYLTGASLEYHGRELFVDTYSGAEVSTATKASYIDITDLRDDHSLCFSSTVYRSQYYSNSGDYIGVAAKNVTYGSRATGFYATNRGIFYASGGSTAALNVQGNAEYMEHGVRHSMAQGVAYAASDGIHQFWRTGSNGGRQWHHVAYAKHFLPRDGGETWQLAASTTIYGGSIAAHCSLNTYFFNETDMSMTDTFYRRHHSND